MADKELVHMAALSHLDEPFWFNPVGKVVLGARSACKQGAEQGARGSALASPAAGGHWGEEQA